MILEGNGFTTDEMHTLCAFIISHISHHCCSLIHSYINNWIHGGFHGYESLYQYHHFTAQQWRPVLILGRKSSPWAPYSSRAGIQPGDGRSSMWRLIWSGCQTIVMGVNYSSLFNDQTHAHTCQSTKRWIFFLQVARRSMCIIIIAKLQGHYACLMYADLYYIVAWWTTDNPFLEKL